MEIRSVNMKTKILVIGAVWAVVLAANGWDMRIASDRKEKIEGKYRLEQGIFGGSGVYEISEVVAPKTISELYSRIDEWVLERLERYEEDLSDEIENGDIRFVVKNTKNFIGKEDAFTTSILTLYLNPPFGDNSAHHFFFFLEGRKLIVMEIATAGEESECLSNMDSAVESKINEYMKNENG